MVMIPPLLEKASKYGTFWICRQKYISISKPLKTMTWGKGWNRSNDFSYLWLTLLFSKHLCAQLTS